MKEYWPVLLSFCYSRILHRPTHASVVFPHHCSLWFQGSFHLRASAGCRSPKHHPVAEVCRDGDEEPPGEPRPQHLGQSHHHPPTSQPVLVRMTLIYTAVTNGKKKKKKNPPKSVNNFLKLSFGEPACKISTLK